MSSWYKYSRWDGTQKIFDIDPEELMEQLSGELLAHGDVWRALRELLRQGMQSPSGEQLKGLKHLLEQLRNQRQQHLQRFNLDSAVDDLKQRLDEVVQTERAGIEKRLQEAREETERAEGAEHAQKESLYKLLEQRAQRNREKLDSLPQSTGGAIKQLMEHDFMDPEAQRQFQELLDMLKGRMVDSYFQGIKERLQGLTPQDMAGIREMVRQLNQMLQDKMAGRQPDFQGFMQQFGPMFGPNPPQSLEELLQRMQSQMAQMQSFMESMSPEMRRELEEALMASLDSETLQEMAELGALMDQLMPTDELRRQYPFIGDEDLSLEQAMQLMGSLQDMDDLERSLQEAMRTGKLGDVDPNKLAEQLGEEARRTWESLQRLNEILEEAGYIKGDDKLELTPRGIRKIGHKALSEMFFQLKKDRAGSHEVTQRGSGGEAITDTKPYEFGDPFQLDLAQTVKNALYRRGPEIPVRFDVKDFEIYRNEHMARAATVLLLDQSRSMGLFGSFQAARKVALALYALIHTQFPRDSLYMVTFSDYAREITEEDLPKVTWNAWVSGTNMQHAFMLSRKLLSKEKGSTRQVILITDGEPTAHLEGGRALFSYPPSHRTITETLKEARRCTQEGIIINTFMLENSYQLMNFVDQLTRINRGRAFYSTPDKLGQYVLVDYVNNRRKRVA